MGISRFKTQKIKFPQKQNGAALLLFILLLVTGASTLLVSKINKASAQYYRDDQAMTALVEAKNVLIGWAAAHPYNPGTLIFPDRNGDNNYDGFSDCTTHPTVGNNLLLGKIPLRGRATSCKDYSTLPDLKLSASDFFGEVLWYAVSKNLLVENTNYPFINTSMLNVTNDWLTVRDRSGNILSDRVAFLLIAPGTSIEDQNRSGVSPDPDNFLDSVSINGTTYDNSDTDLDFIIYPNSNKTSDTTDQFNDQIVFVTIDELMRAVERRVIREAAQIFDQYRNIFGRYPWLSPYADPKVSSYTHLGTATAGSGGSTLEDTSTNFNSKNVLPGYVIENITDGSVGTIPLTGTVNQNDLTVSSLSGGIDNNFDIGDRYRIILNRSGSAGAGSANNILVDNSSGEFLLKGVMIGDVIENITTSTSGIITDVSASSISVAEGASITFTSGHEYRVKNNTGMTSSGSSTTLVNSSLSNDFSSVSSLGIKPENSNIVQNITDGSASLVVTPLPSITTVNIDPLSGGTNNTFSLGDRYIFPRFNSVPIAPTPTSHQGYIPFHEEGEAFLTDFNLTWIPPAGASVTCSQIDPAYIIDYQTSLTSLSSQSFTNGFCTWSEESHVKCWHTVSQSSLNLTVTLNAGSAPTVCQAPNPIGTSSTIIIPRREISVTINYHGVSTVNNLSDSRVRDVVSTATEPIDIEFRIIDFDTSGTRIGEAELVYQGILPANSINTQNMHYDFAPMIGRATTGTSALTLIDATKISFSNRGIEVGDIVENLTDGTTGRVTSYNASSITFVSRGTPALSFSTDDVYVLYHQMPKWFLENQWYKFIYASISSDELSGGTGDCLISGACLTLNNANPNNNHKMILAMAGRELNSQDRSNIAQLSDYFEGDEPTRNENSNNDNSFDQQPFLLQLELFNDLMISAKDCPLPNPGAQICWQ